MHAGGRSHDSAVPCPFPISQAAMALRRPRADVRARFCPSGRQEIEGQEIRDRGTGGPAKPEARELSRRAR